MNKRKWVKFISAKTGFELEKKINEFMDNSNINILQIQYQIDNTTELSERCIILYESFSITSNNKTTDTINLKQYSHKVCDIFENLLDKHNIYIPDNDRSGDEGEACLYGVTYCNLEDEVKEILVEIAEKIKREEIELEVDSY